MLKLEVKDTNVSKVIVKLHTRSQVGQLFYGVTTDKAQMTALQWLQHLQEELLDAAVYIESFLNKKTRRLKP